MNSNRSPFPQKLLVALLLPLWAPANAQTVWIGGTSNDWTTGANWVGGVAPPSSNATHVQFDGTGATFTPNADAAWTLNRLDLTGATSYGVTGDALTLAGTAPQITTSGAVHSIANDISLGATTTFTTGSDLTLSGAISGAGGMGKNGTGQLTLAQVPTHTGTTTIGAGILNIGGGGAVGGGVGDIVNNGALVIDSSSGIGLNGLSGTGTLTKNGSGNLISSGGTFTHSGNTTINGGGVFAAINSAGRLTVNASGQLETLGSTFGSLVGTAAGGNVFINGGGALTVGGDNTSTTYQGAIGGNGSFVKNGTGTLILEQLPGHTGLTTISAGILNIGGGGAVGGGMGDFVNNGALVIDSSSGIGLNGLSGTGTLTKNGSGNLISSGGTFTHSGNTTINGGGVFAAINSAGRLTVNASGQLDTIGSTFGSLVGTAAGGNVFINGGGALTVGGDNTSTTYQGAIGGNGSFVKNGTGTLILEQLPGHTGLTTISAGILNIGGGGAVGGGMGDFVNNGALVIDSSGSSGISLNGLIGTGTLTKNGSDNLVLSGGTFTHSGNTTINGGGVFAAINSAGRLTVNASGQLETLGSTFGSLAGTGAGGNVFINGGGSTLTVGGDNTSTTYQGAIGGNGGLIKNGTGTLTFTGASLSTGAINVNGGKVVMNGSTTAVINLNAGSTLGGSGSIGGLTTAAGAIVAPGNSIGTLTVNGNLNFAAGSIYQVEADAAGASDRINVIGVPGTATIGAGTVDVQAGAGTYAPATIYTIINATGGVTGAFATVTSNLAFLTPSLTYDPNNVFLTLTRNAATFQSVAITPNQIAVSNMLEPIANAGPAGDLGVVTAAIAGLSAAEARAAYDAIGGASIVELRRANVAFARGFGDTLDARIRQPAAARVVVAGPATSVSTENERGFWIKAEASGYKADSDGNAFGNNLRGGGVTFGVDTSLSRDAMVGVAASYGKDRLRFDGIADNGLTRNFAMGAYGQYASGPWTFKAVAGYAFGDNEINRTVAFGAVARAASGKFYSRSSTLYGEANYDMPMRSYRLRPLVGLSWTHARQNGYTETGAGALNLKVAAETTNSVRTLIGVKTLHTSGALRIEPRLVWAHEFGDLNTPLQAQLSGAGAASNFAVSGVRLKRDALTAGLTLAGSVSRGTELFVDVQVGGNSRQTAYAAHAGIRVQW